MIHLTFNMYLRAQIRAATIRLRARASRARSVRRMLPSVAGTPDRTLLTPEE